MLGIQTFEFNPFAENTYVVYDSDSRECWIVDPGCYTEAEQKTLKNFLDGEELKVVKVLNTHCHLDHVFGNHFAVQTWNAGLEIHRNEMPLLQNFTATCRMYGIPGCTASPFPVAFLEPGATLTLGKHSFTILFTPGHSPGSVSFYCAEAAWVLAGDVLFYESIGRTDLPGGHFETLLASIRNELFSLPGETVVYSGHGPVTTIRHEREYNPFL